MAVATYTKTGTKAPTAAKLDKAVFGIDVTDHTLLKEAYVAYLANGRQNLAVTKTRGLVSGGGRKPWKQKGTGRARFGSSRNPIWRGGGIVFGPTGEENYSKILSTKSKQLAIRQALSLAAKENKITVIDDFTAKDGKTAAAALLLSKLQASGRVLLVVANKHELTDRATKNVPSLTYVAANYLNVYDTLNADTIIITTDSLPIISNWLGEK